MNIQVGKLNKKVIKLLSLEYKKEIPIILGDSNIEHMKRQHPNDYEKYGHDIKKIKGNLFTRTLFTMTDRKKDIYLRKGYAKKYK